VSDCDSQRSSASYEEATYRYEDRQGSGQSSVTYSCKDDEEMMKSSSSAAAAAAGGGGGGGSGAVMYDQRYQQPYVCYM